MPLGRGPPPVQRIRAGVSSGLVLTVTDGSYPLHVDFPETRNNGTVNPAGPLSVCSVVSGLSSCSVSRGRGRLGGHANIEWKIRPERWVGVVVLLLKL